MAQFEGQDTVEVKGLEQILKALKARPPVARIGILGNKDYRKDGNTNAEIGAAHEFGTSKLPQRSFLRFPLSENLNKYLEKTKLLDEDTMTEAIKEGSVKPWLTKVAIVAKTVVLDAFSSNGFGKWAAWKGNYTSRTGQILVNTQQLRDSIEYEVK
jgi:phage gpG-like protein